METANTIRERYLEGDSINGMAKRYGQCRNVIKFIIRGETYNKYGEWDNLQERSKSVNLF